MTSARIYFILLGWVEESLGGGALTFKAGGNLLTSLYLKVCMIITLLYDYFSFEAG